MPRTKCPPSYRRHKARNCAVVTIDGRNHYLGLFGSPESHEKYARLIAEWKIARCQPETGFSFLRGSGTALSLNELILAFWDHAKQRYVKNGKPTSEQRSFRVALRPVRQLYGREPVPRFGPLALVACRQKLIEAGICRKRINQHVTRIRHVFKWGVARELVLESVWRSLCAVEGLRVGEAIETEPVKPVPEDHVAAIEPFVTPQIWAMVNLQLWTGCRPGEACLARTIDIKMQGRIWEYRPHSHKAEHHGKERVVYLGPHAQTIIEPWLKSELHAYLFSPREARAWYNAQRAKDRKTPISPSQRRRQPKRAPRRAPGDHYRTLAYDHAVSRACARAGVPSWAPNQLRHNAATRIRAAYGIEAARIILGHSSAVTSEIYAEIDREKAREIMGKLG
ncbi:MAG TPA: site-specific integrase [Thermoguttaceae bacterium]|nr:site-specific integrase [Thermoguttaceae bacterium]